MDGELPWSEVELLLLLGAELGLGVAPPCSASVAWSATINRRMGEWWMGNGKREGSGITTPAFLVLRCGSLAMPLQLQPSLGLEVEDSIVSCCFFLLSTDLCANY